MGAGDALTQARAAFHRRDWLAAYEGLSSLGNDSLRASDFVDLATAAYLLQRHDDCVAALQRAHQSFLAADDVELAVRTAFWLCQVLRQHGEEAVANGWITRAERLAPDLPEDSVERGYLEFARLTRQVFARPREAITASPDVVVDYGRRFGDPNLVAAGLMSNGRRALEAGAVTDGLAFLDEAVVTVINGGLSPIIAGMVLCSAIDGCQELWEFGRIAEWTRALDLWCDDQTGLAEFTGTCSLHKGQVLAQHGDFAGAAAEFEAAVDRFVRGGQTRAMGSALVELGDVRRVQGRLDDADDAFRRAADAGWDAASAQLMLDLARDRIDAAASTARRLLTERQTRTHRAQRCARVVDVLLAAGDVETASSVVTELSAMAATFGTPMFLGYAARSRGALALVRADADAAARELRDAVDQFAAATARYEVACTRLALAEALRAGGDIGAAEREHDLGTVALEQMGAAPPTAADTGPLTERQVEVLRQVALGHSNREIARAMNLSEKTVARHLSNIFVKLGVASRTGAAAYAFEHGIAGDR